MIVDETRHFIDFSDNPEGLLDEEILAQLRDALNSNDHFCKLVFNNNRLTDDAIGTLAAILKGRTPIEYLSLESCDLRDVDITHLVNAICTKKALKYINLRRNPGITSDAIADIARMIRTVPTLSTILLRGTSLESNNCAELMDALEHSSPSLQVVELPYTVGYRVLDGVRKILRKDRTESLDNSYNEKRQKRKTTVTIGGTCMESNNNSKRRNEETREMPLLPKLVAPPCNTFPAGGTSLTKVPQERQQQQQLIQPTRTLEMIEFRNWADPALKNAAVHLYVLDQRCQLLETHKQERRERILAKRGLGIRQNAAEWSTQYYRLVLYNFTAEDNVELTVKKGEVVTPVDGDVMDGWIKVEVLNDTKRRGFVPLNFLRETTQPNDNNNYNNNYTDSNYNNNSNNSNIQQQQPGGVLLTRATTPPPSFTSAALDYGDTLQHMYTHGGPREVSSASRRSLSAEQRTQRPSQVLANTTIGTNSNITNTIPLQRQQTQTHTQTQQQQEQQQQQQQQSLTSLPSNPTSGRSLLNDPNAVIEAFMKNELHFKQLVRQRQDALAQMRSTLEGAIVEMTACKDKNATLARKLRDLDQTIEKERKRWKERIEEEKSYIARSMPQD